MKTIEPSGRMKGVFLFSILLMGFHKIESFKTHEWEFSPLYKYFLHLDLTRSEVLFLAFVVTLFAGLFWLWVVVSLTNGKWIFLGFWGLTFLLEWHHLIRSLNAGQYYPGTITATFYVLFGIIYWHVFISHFVWDKKTYKTQKATYHTNDLPPNTPVNDLQAAAAPSPLAHNN